MVKIITNYFGDGRLSAINANIDFLLLAISDFFYHVKHLINITPSLIGKMTRYDQAGILLAK